MPFSPTSWSAGATRLQPPAETIETPVGVPSADVPASHYLHPRPPSAYHSA
jgi:hypothetical protein